MAKTHVPVKNKNNDTRVTSKVDSASSPKNNSKFVSYGRQCRRWRIEGERGREKKGVGAVGCGLSGPPSFFSSFFLSFALPSFSELRDGRARNEKAMKRVNRGAKIYYL